MKRNASEWVWMAVALSLLIFACLVIAACTLFQHDEVVNRSIEMDCRIETPDGYVMRCENVVERKDDTKKAGKELKPPKGY